MGAKEVQRLTGSGRSIGRLFVALGAAILVVVSLGLRPAPAAAWTPGACPTLTTGVTVVVDLTAFDGGIAVRCAPGSPSSGVTALGLAGFSVVQVQLQPGFVCRIDGLPGPPEECVTTPPATASWSYWTADRGGAWTYSAMGAGGRTPPVGSVEGWAFAEGASATPPGIDPPPAPGGPPTAAPTAAVTARPPTAAPTAAPASAGGAASLAPGASEPASVTTPSGSASASGSPSTTASPSSTDASVEAVPSPTATAEPVEASAPPALGALLGAGVILAVVAVAVAVRRPSSFDPDG